MRADLSLQLPDTIDPDWKVGIVASSFYKEEIDALISGAESALLSAGLSVGHIQTHWAAGSFEIPLIGSALAESKQVDALIGLGIIIEGETEHARLLAEQAARGVMDVQMKYSIPFAFEILYVKSLQLARERASGEQNKGNEAAHAVLHSLAKLHSIRS